MERTFWLRFWALEGSLCIHELKELFQCEEKKNQGANVYIQNDPYL